MVLDEVIERVWSQGDPWAGPRRTKAPHPSPIPGMYTLTGFPPWEPFSRMQPWERTWCWPHQDSIWDWTPSRPLHKLLRFWQAGGCRGLLVSLCPRQASYVSSLLPKPASSQSGGAALSSVSPCRLCSRPCFRFHPKAPEVSNQQRPASSVTCWGQVQDLVYTAMWRR